MFYQVECFGHIHQATVHVATIPEEVADSLNDSPGAYIGGDSRLVGNPKIRSEQNQNDPIDQFPKKTTIAIVLLFLVEFKLPNLSFIMGTRVAKRRKYVT